MGENFGPTLKCAVGQSFHLSSPGLRDELGTENRRVTPQEYLFSFRFKKKKKLENLSVLVQSPEKGQKISRCCLDFTQTGIQDSRNW